jgi:hypothetical protein
MGGTGIAACGVRRAKGTAEAGRDRMIIVETFER